MNKDKAKGTAKRPEDTGKAGKPIADKKAGAAEKASEMKESTKKGLGKTEDKIRDRLKG